MGDIVDGEKKKKKGFCFLSYEVGLFLVYVVGPTMLAAQKTHLNVFWIFN